MDESIKIVLIEVLVAWVLFFILTIWKPQRFSNSFLLMISIFITLFALAISFGDSAPFVMIVIVVLILLILFLVPIMLVLNGRAMIKKESRSLGSILSLLLGIVIGVGEIACIILFFDYAEIRSNTFVWSVTLLIFLSVFYFSCLILSFVLYIIMLSVVPRRAKYDYIVIHGSGLLDGDRVPKLLSDRIDKGIEIYNKCRKKPMIIPSGGQGRDETVSEALAIKKYLVAHGIPEDNIILEDKSINTIENLRNSKAIIESREGSHKTALVSSNYHVYRCLLYAKSLKWKCTGVGAKVASYYWPSAVLREFVAVFTKGKHLAWTIVGYIFLAIIPVLIFAFA